MLVIITISLIVYIFFLKSGLVSVPNTNKIQTLGKHTIDKAQALKNLLLTKYMFQKDCLLIRYKSQMKIRKNIQTTDRGIQTSAYHHCMINMKKVNPNKTTLSLSRLYKNDQQRIGSPRLCRSKVESYRNTRIEEILISLFIWNAFSLFKTDLKFMGISEQNYPPRLESFTTGILEAGPQTLWQTWQAEEARVIE